MTEPKKARGGRLPDEARALELNKVEDVLERCGSARKAKSELVRILGMDDRTAARAIKAVAQRWANESDGQSREERRAVLREALWDLMRVARDRKRMSTVLIGHGQSELVPYPDPDVKGAAAVASLLIQLDDLGEAAAPAQIFGDSLFAQFQTFFGLGAAAALAKSASELPAEIVVEAEEK